MKFHLIYCHWRQLRKVSSSWRSPTALDFMFLVLCLFVLVLFCGICIYGVGLLASFSFLKLSFSTLEVFKIFKKD